MTGHFPDYREDDKLPDGAISGTDDGQTVWLESSTGGAHRLGMWGGLSLRFTEADGSFVIRDYVATDATTTPASGSDGLETLQQLLHSTFIDEPSRPRLSPDEKVALNHHLVTREAAEKRIGELEADLDRVIAQRDSHWDEYLAERQSRLEHGAREAGYMSQVAALKAALVEAHTELVACSEYLDPMIDADGDSEGFYPNREMTLQGGVNRAIERAEQALALKEGR